MSLTETLRPHSWVLNADERGWHRVVRLDWSGFGVRVSFACGNDPDPAKFDPLVREPDDAPDRLAQCAGCRAEYCRWTLRGAEHHDLAHLLFGNCPHCLTASNGNIPPYWNLPDGVDLSGIQEALPPLPDYITEYLTSRDTPT